MKFLYEYRTPDNEKHSGTINAADREAAYAALKRKGIKPCRFSEAPGVFNKVFGKGKRWMAIGALCALCLVLFAVLVRTKHEVRSSMHELDLFDGQTRRQPIGDSAIIDEGIRTGWADVFDLEGERFLASFAIPGTQPAVRSTTEDEIRKALNAPDTKRQAPSTTLEERQIRAMVEGMKQELREFIGDGGSLAAYGRRLVRRQEEELAYYNRAKNEVENAVQNGEPHKDVEALLRANNAALRKMGIRLVVMPEAKEAQQ